MTRVARLRAWQCPRGHTALHGSDTCTECREGLRVVDIAPDATLLFVTTVRVNPSGQPFQLGIAVTRSGRARTLCRVEGTVRGLGNDPVLLERRDGVIVARPRNRA